MLLGPVAPALDLFNSRQRVRLLRWKGSMAAGPAVNPYVPDQLDE